jgi:hypothetical protein
MVIQGRRDYCKKLFSSLSYWKVWISKAGLDETAAGDLYSRTQLKKGRTVMGQVVSIYANRFLGEYCAAQSSARLEEDAVFFTGVFLTVVAPTISYCAQGGPVSPIVFAAGAALGTVLGLIKYYRVPDRPVSHDTTGTASQNPPAEDVVSKKRSGTRN